MSTMIVPWAIMALVSGGFGEWIAGRKHRDGLEGFLLGFVLGPIGPVVEMILPNGPVGSFRRAPARPPRAREGPGDRAANRGDSGRPRR